ncbi:MAG TPA: ABC transporter permease [Vicinamibacterales bacterium]|nr:ABC transporter permease [Vicinamibacterales bacterium]
MSRTIQDLRHALRVTWRSPLVSLLAVGAFALGIAVTTTVFSIFHGVLLKPLPYPSPDQLVMVFDTQPACSTCPASFPKFHDWKSRNQVFAAIGGSTPAGFVLSGHGDPLQLDAVRTTASLVDVFGVQPAMGRWFSEDEDRPGAAKVVVLSHGLWTETLASDPAVLGKALTLDGEPYEIVGVMPEGFAHRGARIFVPLATPLDPSTRGTHFLSTYARLKPGVPIERAASDMRALGRVLAAEFGHNHGIDVASYREVIVGTIRPQLRMLLGAVFAVLLIGCANVANLLLAAGLARRRELGIRLALGARTSDLARQLIAESATLAVAGGAIGVVLAFWLLRTFLALATDQLPRATTIAIDGRVLAFSGVVTLCVALVCGLWPLLQLRTKALVGAVREGDTRTGSGPGGQFGNGLVITEIAMAFALLVGGALLVKNLMLLQARDAGVATERVIAFDLAPSGERYTAEEPTRAFYRALHARLSQAGGVQSVGSVSHLPMYRFGTNGEMQIEGRAPWGPNDAPLVEYRWYHGDYFKTLGIPLLKGRLLDQRDGDGTTTVLVNRAMAEKFWPGQDAIGKRFGQGNDRSQWYEVVGIVGDIRSFGLARPTPFEFYRTLDQHVARSSQTVVMRAVTDNPSALIPTARQIVRSIDPAIPVTSVQTMEEVVAGSVGQQRLVSATAGVFALLAALLAMVGVFGVMTYNVRRQRREIGIRLALGATRPAVRRLIIGRGLKLALIGSAAGALGAYLLSGALQTMLDDVAPKDPLVFAGTGLAVIAAAVLASYLPALAAGRTDPMVVLRDS